MAEKTGFPGAIHEPRELRECGLFQSFQQRLYPSRSHIAVSAGRAPSEPFRNALQALMDITSGERHWTRRAVVYSKQGNRSHDTVRLDRVVGFVHYVDGDVREKIIAHENSVKSPTAVVPPPYVAEMYVACPRKLRRDFEVVEAPYQRHYGIGVGDGTVPSMAHMHCIPFCSTFCPSSGQCAQVAAHMALVSLCVPGREGNAVPLGPLDIGILAHDGESEHHSASYNPRRGITPQVLVRALGKKAHTGVVAFEDSLAENEKTELGLVGVLLGACARWPHRIAAILPVSGSGWLDFLCREETPLIDEEKSRILRDNLAADPESDGHALWLAGVAGKTDAKPASMLVNDSLAGPLVEIATHDLVDLTTRRLKAAAELSSASSSPHVLFVTVAHHSVTVSPAMLARCLARYWSSRDCGRITDARLWLKDEFVDFLCAHMAPQSPSQESMMVDVSWCLARLDAVALWGVSATHDTPTATTNWLLFRANGGDPEVVGSLDVVRSETGKAVLSLSLALFSPEEPNYMADRWDWGDA